MSSRADRLRGSASTSSATAFAALRRNSSAVNCRSVGRVAYCRPAQLGRTRLVTRIEIPFPLIRPVSPCPVCGAADAWRIGTRDRDGGPLNTAMCRQCGHGWTDPQPSAAELADFYARRYRAKYKRVIEPKRYHVLRAARVAAQRLRRLRQVAAAGRHLDIGAGGGEFSYLVRHAGMKVTALEPNEGYAQWARKSYGLDVVTGTLESADFGSASFDSATLFHVLEHLRAPQAALRRIAGWLREGGYLYLEVPNLLDVAQSPRSRFHRAHIHHFTERTLAMVLAQAGFVLRAQWLSPDHGVISAIAQCAGDVSVPAADPAHALAAARVLARHTPARHFARLGWMARGIRKHVRRFEEKLSASKPADAQQLVRAGLKSSSD